MDGLAPLPGLPEGHAASSSWLEGLSPALAGGWMDAHPEASLALGLLAGMLLLSQLLRLARGRGELVVAIDLPTGQRGSFSVRVCQRRERRPRPARGELPDRPPRAPMSSRFAQHMVARVARFRGLPARSYYVALEGVIESAPGAAGELVYEEAEVRVPRGQTVRVDFDLRPQQSLVELRVLRGGRPARAARVALAGDPTSIRFAPGGVARLSLPQGHHTLLVGSEDRASEHTLEITDLASRTVAVDLDEAADRVFVDCPAAVEPFLRGDLSVAATALQRAGQETLAHLLAARFHHDRGDLAQAATHFEGAGRWLEAAELRSEQGELAQAAALFEKAGDASRAAETYQAAGDWLRAGRAFQEAEDLDAAIDCYRRADAIPELLDALEKKGDAFEAGELALASGDTARALRALQQVESRHPAYYRACRTLADLFHTQGKLDLAVQKAEEAITFAGPEEGSPETYVWYGDLLEASGRSERALRVFRDLKERAPGHPDLAERIDALERKISAEHRAPPGALRHGAVTGFLSERYEILDELGAGGMGVVYRARDRRLGREVALKRLPNNLKDHPHALELFLREARAAAVLNHPNIVTVHDVEQDDQGLFLTMELLVGTPLSDVVRARGRVSPRDTARLGLQVSAGLAYAHGRRIIHRDIKTANLFFTHDKVVKIMDFGLAKPMEEVRRASTVIGGTPYYMAPEQAVGDAVDHRADLYGFGATLFELLTGRPPFTEGDIAFHHRHTPAPDPRERVAEVPAELAELVRVLLAKRPADRPESAEEVGRRLQAIAASLKRGARPRA